jgi:hypothetical protein
VVPGEAGRRDQKERMDDKAGRSSILLQDMKSQPLTQAKKALIYVSTHIAYQSIRRRTFCALTVKGCYQRPMPDEKLPIHIYLVISWEHWHTKKTCKIVEKQKE